MAGTKRKKTSQGGRRGGPKRLKTRMGFTSVARTRGAAVTGEMKYFDTAKSGAIPASADWTGTELDPTTFNTLCVPAVGAAINQRIGKQIKVLKIKIRGFVGCAAQTGQAVQDEASYVRLCLYQDTQTNSTQAQGENVMSDGGSAALTALSYQNIDNFGRFRMLKDKSFMMQKPSSLWNGTNVLQGGMVTGFKWTINFKKPVVVRFNSTNGGTVADIVDNSFHIIGTTNSATLVPNIHYYSRVCYKE